jgi:preprotein translocase subunit SecF
MRRLPRLVPDVTNIPFMRFRTPAIVGSALVVLLALLLVVTVGLNRGIDFMGGILLEVRMPQAADLGAMRSVLGSGEFGAVQLQEFGEPTDVLIRIQQPAEVDERDAPAVIERVKVTLEESFGGGIEYRRAEFVGPKVSEELLWDGVMATAIAIAGVLVYLWFRFEWQYGIGAIVTLVHDTAATIGFFVITGLQFDLSSVAAILTIIGYSLNDTVVVYDRVRENLRKYKRLPLVELIDKSLNDTLARTLVTGMTTLLALTALAVFGGEVIRSFTVAMIFGVVIGTYSSIFIGAPVLIYFKLRALPSDEKEEAAAQPAE